MNLNEVDQPPAGQLSRRGILKAAGLAGIGVAAAFTVDLAASAAANAAPRPLAALNAKRDRQEGWAFCKDCCGMYYAFTSLDDGHCSTGGSHRTTQTATDYWFFTADSIGQSNWRWCNRCALMFWGGSDGGVCPVGGAHYGKASANYAVWYDGNSWSYPAQAGWRYCSACNGLVWHNSSGYIRQCPATSNGNHLHGSRNYIVAVES